MPQLHIHTSAQDESLVPEIMQMIVDYRNKHRPMRQLVALHQMLKECADSLSKKHERKEKEKREEKE